MSGKKKKAGRVDFWGRLRDSAGKGIREKPCFSGSWIDLGETDIPLRDRRRNRFLRTELHVSEGGTERLYRALPHEYELNGEQVGIIRSVISGMQLSPPPISIMEDESRLRRYTEGRAQRSLSEMDLKNGETRVPVLARICAQYSTGYGLIEHLLRDERVQDIYVDSPPEASPVYVQVGGNVETDLQGIYPTNFYLTVRELERISSILRFTSRRPFSEAHPVLECDLSLYNARVTAVGPPLSPNGISLALRKHSHDPWTLLRLIDAGTLDSLTAAFLNLCLDTRATVLVAGPRGAGKTSLLGALLFEMDVSQRMIIIEDTPELPVPSLVKEGFKVLSLLVGENRELSPGKALRTALRLGESILVLGEVRGPETKTLYEAMTAGTAGSSVLGTFHADSAGSVYKRAVNDLGVAPGSFAATDLIIVSGLVRPGGKRTFQRRVVGISEVVKSEPGAFNDLFRYDTRKDRLIPSADVKKCGIISRIASSWGWGPDQVWNEIVLRERVYSELALLFDRSTRSRPETTVSALGAFRNTREIAVAGGWVHEGDRFLEEWGELLTGGWM